MSFRPPIPSPGSRFTLQPTSLSTRAARELEAGPMDAVTLMRAVCQVDRLQPDAADRMASALLGARAEFVRLPSGSWALANGPSYPSPRPSARLVRDRPSPFDEEALRDSPLLADVTFAVVDVETTGARASTTDRVTEVAIATVRGGAVVDVYSQLVNPQRSIPAHITALTQITWEMVRDQPTFEAIAHVIGERLQGSIFTAHNATFDWRFVSEEMRRGAGVQLDGPKLCTVRLARLLVPALSRRSLDHVSHHFGIDNHARHRAAGDAEATAKALIRMLEIARERGIETWAQLDAAVSSPAVRKRRTASDRRRRAFPHAAVDDHHIP